MWKSSRRERYERVLRSSTARSARAQQKRRRTHYLLRRRGEAAHADSITTTAIVRRDEQLAGKVLTNRSAHPAKDVAHHHDATTAPPTRRARPAAHRGRVVPPHITPMITWEAATSPAPRISLAEFSTPSGQDVHGCDEPCFFPRPSGADEESQRIRGGRRPIRP